MSNMASVIAPKSDQINADDLLSGPITITITDVVVKPGEKQPVSISFEGSTKVYRPCKSMCRVMVAAWGSDEKAYQGRRMRLYRDPSATFEGVEVGGIRISHMSHLSREMVMAMTVARGRRKPYVVKPLEDDGNKDELRRAAMQVAAQGREAFRRYWQGLTAADRQALKDIMPDLERAASEADIIE